MVFENLIMREHRNGHTYNTFYIHVSLLLSFAAIGKFQRIPYYDPKIWTVSENGAVKFQSLTEDTLEDALKVMRDSFIPSENLCKAVDLSSETGAVEELMKTCLHCAQDGVSIVARDVDTSEVVGVIFNKIQVPAPKGKSFYEKFSKACKYKSSKAIIDFTIDVESKVNLFNLYNVDSLLEIMYIVTKVGHGKRQIGELLAKSSMELGKQLLLNEDIKTPVHWHPKTVGSDNNFFTNNAVIPKIIAGLTTSNYSQKLGEKLGYDKIVEVSYDDYRFNGRKFSEKIGNTHKTCQLVAKRLSDI